LEAFQDDGGVVAAAAVVCHFETRK
jgi:hypothetical protein